MNTTFFNFPGAAFAFFDVQNWPFWVAIAIQLLAALMNYRMLRVPNWFTFGGILSAFVVGLLLTLKLIELGKGSFDSAFVAMFVGGVFLIPFYAIASLGAGCVKTQAAYGAWLGCAFPIETAALLVGVTTVAGALVCLVVGTVVGIIVKNRPSDPEKLVLLPAQELISAASLITLVAWLHFIG